MPVSSENVLPFPTGEDSGSEGQWDIEVDLRALKDERVVAGLREEVHHMLSTECFNYDTFLGYLRCRIEEVSPLSLKLLVDNPRIVLQFVNEYGHDALADHLLASLVYFTKESLKKAHGDKFAWIEENTERNLRPYEEPMLVDCNSTPSCGQGCEIVTEGKKLGQITWDKERHGDVSLLFSAPEQQPFEKVLAKGEAHQIGGHDLYHKYLKRMMVANEPLLSWLHEHQDQIPESWNAYKGIVFWGTLYEGEYEHNGGKVRGRFVWMLVKYGKGEKAKWYRQQAWLDFMFRAGYPAFILPND